MSTVGLVRLHLSFNSSFYSIISTASFRGIFSLLAVRVYPIIPFIWVATRRWIFLLYHWAAEENSHSIMASKPNQWPFWDRIFDSLLGERIWWQAMVRLNTARFPVHQCVSELILLVLSASLMVLWFALRYSSLSSKTSICSDSDR